MSSTSFEDRIPNPDDTRDHQQPKARLPDYRQSADAAERRLWVAIRDATDVELQATAHVTAGNGPTSYPVYQAILDTLRDRKRAAERAHNSKRTHQPNLSREPSTESTRSYKHTGHCRSPIPVGFRNDAGAERYQLAGCGYCEPCRKRAAEVTAHQAVAVVGSQGYAWNVAEERYRAEVVKLNRRGIEWFQVPGPNDTRRIIATEPVGPSVPVEVADVARDAELTRPDDDTRRSSYRGQRARDPDARPPTRQDIERELFGTSATVGEGFTRCGFWHLSTLRARTIAEAGPELVELAAVEYGLPAKPTPGGVEIAADADRIALARFRRRIGFVELALTRRRQQVPPELPIAEAYELWKRWQETTEPPAAVYDQLAMLEVA